MEKRDPWWPIEYGHECGKLHSPHKRITLPTMEVFAFSKSELNGGTSFGIAVMSTPGLEFTRYSYVIYCNDALEQRAALLDLAYPSR